MAREAYILAIILTILGLVLSGLVLFLVVQPSFSISNNSPQIQTTILIQLPQKTTQQVQESLPFPSCLISHDITLYLPSDNWDNQAEILGHTSSYFRVVECSRDHHRLYNENEHNHKYDYNRLNYYSTCPAENYPIWNIDNHIYRGTLTQEDLARIVNCN